MTEPREIPLCLFCGGDPSAPGHRDRCDGRQGAREAALEDGAVPSFDPWIVSGIVPETLDTSTAAAAEAESGKDTQRAAVLAAIRAAGADGATDDELQARLGLDGNSERARRWELWKRDAIRIRRDADGRPIQRLTRRRRRAVVWVLEEV